MVFGKKKEESNESKGDVPVQAVLSMKQRNMSNDQVIEQLKSQGYSLQSIKDALTQADVKQSAITPAPPAPPAPKAGPELPPLPGEAPTPALPAQPAISPVRGEPELAPATGLPSLPEAPKAGFKVEEMERILEEIVDERWSDVTSKFSDLETARAKQETRIDELSKRVSELSSRLDEISSVVMGKVDEYKKTMEDVDVEIKALEKVMQKLVPSMAEQVKDLKEVVGGLKGGSTQ